MKDDEWGPWIEHDGKGRPVPLGTVAEVTERANCDGDDWITGDERTGVVIVVSEYEAAWFQGRALADIIRYRIRKPRAMQILRDIAASPERELETTL